MIYLQTAEWRGVSGNLQIYIDSWLVSTELLPLSTRLEHNFPNATAFWESGEGKRALSFH